MPPQAPPQPPVSAGPPQPYPELPRWEQLAPSVRQALMISLTALLVKQLAEQAGEKEQHDE